MAWIPDYELRYYLLKDLISPLGANERRIYLLSRIPESVLTLINLASLFQIAQVIGEDQTAKLFFEVRELYRQSRNPTEIAADLQSWKQLMLSLYDKLTEDLEYLNLSNRADIDASMIKPGGINLEWAQLDRSKLENLLDEEIKKELAKHKQVPRQIAQTLQTISQDNHLSPNDLAILLNLLGIEINEDRLAVIKSDHLYTDNQTYYNLLLQIAGSFSPGWQQFVMNNPAADLNLYQLLKNLEADEAPGQLATENLAQSLSPNDLLSLINGPSLIGNWLEIAIKIFLDRIDGQIINKTKLDAARQEINSLLSTPNPDHSTIYEILSPLLIEAFNS